MKALLRSLPKEDTAMIKVYKSRSNFKVTKSKIMVRGEMSYRKK